MTPTQNLLNEHKIIIELLGFMRKIATKIKSKGIFYTNDVDDIIYFLNNFIEKSHHEKEGIFYPELSNSNIPIDKEAISIMLYEHILTNNCMKDINNCVVNCKLGNSFSGDLLAESLINYASLIEGHMNKELEIIFPIADKSLNQEKQNEILKKFETIDKKIESHGFKESYNKLITSLRLKYPD